MNSKDSDFLDEIFAAELKQYSDAYCAGFQLTSNDAAAAAELPDRSSELRSSWIRGLQYGAQLGSELYFYKGLAEEVLASYSSNSVEEFGKQHPAYLARRLLHLLNDSPGPLSRACDMFVKQPMFEEDLALIRSKAKQLISALRIGMVSKAMDSLDF
uniref:Yae1_N domain-containing protein n=1 Tax=Mesocestoides corti TaxID=53468 RepID=A0A5K3F1N3_MESCO